MARHAQPDGVPVFFASPLDAAYSSAFALRSFPTGEFTVGPRPRIALAVSCFLCLSRLVRAEEPTAPPTPAQLAAMERVRPLVEAVWLDVRTPSPTGEGTGRYFFDYTDRLIAIGPDVVPFMVSELELVTELSATR